MKENFTDILTRIQKVMEDVTNNRPGAEDCLETLAWALDTTPEVIREFYGTATKNNQKELENQVSNLNDKLRRKDAEIQAITEKYDEKLLKMQQNKDHLQGLIQEQRNATAFLQKQFETLRDKQNANAGILTIGKEAELFPEEFKQMLVDIMETLIKTLPNDCRRYHVLESLIEQNKTKETVENKRDIVKGAFRGYKCFTSKIDSEIGTLGITRISGGKHEKLEYFGDARYSVPVSTTASDVYAGHSIASDIIKKML